MKKGLLIFSLVFAMWSITNCTKDTVLSDPEVQFNLNSVLTGGFKTGMVVPICSDLVANYVLYKIDNLELKPIPVFYVNGVPWTNSIKMSAGTHTISEFLVYNDHNTPNDLTDDILLSAVPHNNSEFAKYVSTPLEQTFVTTNGKKTEVKLDVVCYQPEVSGDFGFVYFSINPIVVRELWFFGDFCIKEKSDYSSSLYAQQSNWSTGTGFIDVPAITKVEVWKNDVLAETFSNAPQGEKLRVTYADELRKTDAFQIKLFILVKQGTDFVYVNFKNWTFNNISNIPQGTDGIVDFVLGNCYDPLSPPDLILAPWMNLPNTVTYTITAQPSTLGGYVDATLTNVPIGYDISNGVYGSNCADHTTFINIGVQYNMNVYSTLYPEKLPLFAQSDKWEKINWIYNHLNYYPNYQWNDIQGAIWLYDNPIWNGQAEYGMPTLTPLSIKMRDDANLYGVGYKVPTGGWAGIVFIPSNTLPSATSPTIQTMFIKIDP